MYLPVPTLKYEMELKMIMITGFQDYELQSDFLFNLYNCYTEK